MHLTAARLGRREIHLMAQPLEHRDHGLTGVGDSVSVGHVTNKPMRIKPPPLATLQDTRPPRQSTPADTSDLSWRPFLASGSVREQRRPVPGPHRLAAADNRERR
jgi:hypothetical protein